MRVFFCARPSRTAVFGVCLAVAALVLASLGIPAQASETTLEAAQQERASVQQRLDEVLGRLDELQAEMAEVEQRVADLRSAAQNHQQSARQADRLMLERVRDAYKRGQVLPAMSLFTSGEPTDVAERTRLLAIIARHHRSDAEQASSAQLRANASAEQVATAVAELDARKAELDAARSEVSAALEAAQAREAEIRRRIAAEEAARARAARQQAAARETSTTTAPSAPSPSSSAGGGAAVRGGVACPVGTPRSYSDTYGAPRSGGRSHMGTDILSPHGTPIYAYEDGTIERMNSSSLGGISLYLRGSSGNLYYYTHLSGYAAGAAAGRRVSAGTHIAYNGDTGNAAGIPHLHFEVMPGGGSNVNPYPYVYRACG